jgi:hypothetical protein
MLFKNAAGQGVPVFVRDTSANTGKTGDAANITMYVSKDGASPVETATGVSEIGGGMYWLALSQAETNANAMAIYGSSTTSNIVVDSVIATTTAGAIPMATFGTSGGIASYENVAAVPTGLALATDLSDLQDDVTSIMGSSYVETHALDQSSGLADMADAVLDEALSGHVAAGTAGLALADRYWTQFVYDGGITTDVYECCRWFKNDEPIDSGVTSPTIQVITGSTGADLIAETAMSEAGSSHLFRYTAVGGEVATTDASYAIRFTATIDGASRTFESTFLGAE